MAKALVPLIPTGTGGLMRPKGPPQQGTQSLAAKRAEIFEKAKRAKQVKKEEKVRTEERNKRLKKSDEALAKRLKTTAGRNQRQEAAQKKKDQKVFEKAAKKQRKEIQKERQGRREKAMDIIIKDQKAFEKAAKKQIKDIQKGRRGGGGGLAEAAKQVALGKRVKRAALAGGAAVGAAAAAKKAFDKKADKLVKGLRAPLEQDRARAKERKERLERNRKKAQGGLVRIF
jgi:hypothetical protein